MNLNLLHLYLKDEVLKKQINIRHLYLPSEKQLNRQQLFIFSSVVCIEWIVILCILSFIQTKDTTHASVDHT